MKLRLTTGGSRGFKGFTRGSEERRESRKACSPSRTSREVGSGYSVNDLLKDGSRRRGPLPIVTYIATAAADSSRLIESRLDLFARRDSKAKKTRG